MKTDYPIKTGSRVEFVIETESRGKETLIGVVTCIGGNSIYDIQLESNYDVWEYDHKTDSHYYNHVLEKEIKEKYSYELETSTFTVPQKNAKRIPWSESQVKRFVLSDWEDGFYSEQPAGYEEYWDLIPGWMKEFENNKKSKEFHVFRADNLKSFIIPVLSNYAVSYAGSEPEKFNVPSMVKFGFQIAEEAIKQLYVKLGNELPTEEDSNGN